MQATLVERPKVNVSHCLIRLNISSENNDFDFNSIPKINFSKFSF